MVNKKILISLISIIVFMSCEQKSHIITFTNENTDSKMIDHPSGCYKVKLIADGVLDCNTNIELFMDGKKTNFTDHLILKGINSGKEIYFSDWYDNGLQIKLKSMKCINRKFTIHVKFFN